MLGRKDIYVHIIAMIDLTTSGIKIHSVLEARKHLVINQVKQT